MLVADYVLQTNETREETAESRGLTISRIKTDMCLNWGGNEARGQMMT